MSSDPAVRPKIHYHIRWLVSGQLDREPHGTRLQAEESAKQLSRQDEQYTIEPFDETCVKCANARAHFQ